jgi:hypothetical protein
MTYERLRAYCESNGLSMSEFVETRIGDFLGRPSRKMEKQPTDEVTAKKVAERFFTF